MQSLFYLDCEANTKEYEIYQEFYKISGEKIDFSNPESLEFADNSDLIKMKIKISQQFNGVLIWRYYGNGVTNDANLIGDWFVLNRIVDSDNYEYEGIIDAKNFNYIINALKVTDYYYFSELGFKFDICWKVTQPYIPQDSSSDIYYTLTTDSYDDEDLLYNVQMNFFTNFNEDLKNPENLITWSDLDSKYRDREDLYVQLVNVSSSSIPSRLYLRATNNYGEIIEDIDKITLKYYVSNADQDLHGFYSKCSKEFLNKFIDNKLETNSSYSTCQKGYIIDEWISTGINNMDIYAVTANDFGFNFIGTNNCGACTELVGGLNMNFSEPFGTIVPSANEYYFSKLISVWQVDYTDYIKIYINLENMILEKFFVIIIIDNNLGAAEMIKSTSFIDGSDIYEGILISDTNLSLPIEKAFIVVITTDLDNIM